MSSNTSQVLEDNIEKEELEALNESNSKKESEVLDIQDDEKPIEQDAQAQKDDQLNPYLQFLAETFDKNQEKQQAEAVEITDSGEYPFYKQNGEEVVLKYGMLTRDQDVRVRAMQRKWVKVRNLLKKVHDSQRDPENDKQYQEFNIKDYMGNSLTRGKITGESSVEEVIEFLDELHEQIYQERLEVFAECFFGITKEQIDTVYAYKRMTFLLEVAYSSYSTVPY